MIKIVAIIALVAVGLSAAYLAAHWALIELGREVVVLGTRNSDGELLKTRLWIVDHDGFAWLHGNPSSGWMRRLAADSNVEIGRHAEVTPYRAVFLPGPHPAIDAALREKYGLADRWVRFLSPDDERTTAVRLEPLRTERTRDSG